MRKIAHVLGACAAIAIIVTGLVIVGKRGAKCHVRTEPVFVEGSSMHGVVTGGSEVTAEYNYYACHEMVRNDIVLYQYSGNSRPVLKFVKGLPGDQWSLKEVEGGSQIIVNGAVVVNSHNMPYVIDESRSRLLSLYVEDYKGIIPENSYLLLGNLPNGSVDSTQFGLAHGGGVIARILLK